jgi:hypothetical protein
LQAISWIIFWIKLFPAFDAEEGIFWQLSAAGWAFTL